MLFFRLRFRFGDPDDVKAYGDGWHVWDEIEIAGLRARDQIALEELVDMPLFTVIKGLRNSDTLASMAAMWIALHREGHPVKWADFNPVSPALGWEELPAVPLEPGSGEDPPTDSNSSEPPSEESATSS